MLEQTKQFIAIKTLANHKKENQAGIQFVTNYLTSMGFDYKIEGESPYHQPVIVARNQSKSDRKIVLYGHYDVEKISPEEQWNTPPFELTEIDNRLYGRGIADNKGILLTRIIALQEMINDGEPLPQILWIIQGEEEIMGQTPFEVIPRHFAEFGAKIYVEETGYHKNGEQMIFHLPKSDTPPPFLDDLNRTVFANKAVIKRRMLRKLSKCPFVTNIPFDEGAHYIGFGPNDSLSNIHQQNESLNKALFLAHKTDFKRFMRWTLNAEL